MDGPPNKLLSLDVLRNFHAYSCHGPAGIAIYLQNSATGISVSVARPCYCMSYRYTLRSQDKLIVLHSVQSLLSLMLLLSLWSLLSLMSGSVYRHCCHESGTQAVVIAAGCMGYTILSHDCCLLTVTTVSATTNVTAVSTVTTFTAVFTVTAVSTVSNVSQ